MTLYDLIIEELRHRGIAYVRRFAPVYIASVGAHLLNLHNREHRIYYELGRVPDLRAHIMFVAPPGFSKSLIMEQFLRGDHALLRDSGIETAYEGTMTEAGFVGTKRFNQGEVIDIEGAAFEHRKAILGVEEFSALASMMRAQHSSTLDAAFLNALDHGWLAKRLAAGKIYYRTFLTLWAGTQPMRFDLSSGLARRFVFICFIPTAQERQVIKTARRKARGRRFSVHRTLQIRAALRKVVVDVNDISEVAWPEQLYRLLDCYDIPHYEEALYERIALGYALMNQPVQRKLTVKWDSELENIMKRIIYWRAQAKFGAQYAQVIMLIHEYGGTIKLESLYRALLYYGLDARQTDALVQDLLRMKILRLVAGEVQLTGKYGVQNEDERKL